MKPTIRYIDTQKTLESYCASIANTKVMAVDTEFVREKTYYPNLSLIQVATDDSLVCIDPLSIEDLKPFLDLLYNDEIVKVFHAASQDLEIFFQLTGAVPKNLFDTQIAASLLGHGEQIGYANLMHNILQVKIDKGQSRTNWMQRPLHHKQIEYAANDVLYLLQAYPIIKKSIDDENRFEWLVQNSQKLVSESSYDVNVDNIWQKVKHCNKLRGVQLAVLQSLARWREERAINKNIPRKWVMYDDILFDLARISPKTPDDAASIRGIDKLEKYLPTLLNLINDALKLPQDEWPELQNRIKINSEQQAMIDIINAIIKLKADENNISINNIASRKELEKLVTGNRDIKLIKEAWLFDIAGKAIVDFLEGRVNISINAQQKITFN